jgi:hypothetical protein
LRVLIACEFSGVVRRAFRAEGHDAWSCDILPAEDASPHHIQDDVRNWLRADWDLLIAHPPCTDLAVSGARWFKEKGKAQQADALRFVREMMIAPVGRVAVENPISVISSKVRKPDQIFHPYHFGHPEFKQTCLWLRGLEPLAPRNALTPPERGTDEYKAWSKVHNAPPSEDRWAIRSRTYEGVAMAMAEQWGSQQSRQGGGQ